MNRAKCSALPPPGHEVTQEERRLLGEAGLPIAEDGIIVVGVPIGTDDFTKSFAADVINKGGAGELARLLARMPDKQVAHLITSMSLVQRSAYIERGIDHTLVSGACASLDNLVMWVLESGMGLRNIEDEDHLLDNEEQPSRFKLRPYQQAQARLSTGAGGLGLPATMVRRFSASIGNLVSTLPNGIVTLRGQLGECENQDTGHRLSGADGRCDKGGPHGVRAVGGSTERGGAAILGGMGPRTIRREWATEAHRGGAGSS